MVNIFWLAFLLFGIGTAAANGKVEAVTTAAFEAAQTAVHLSLELMGLMALWLGILRLAEEAGLVSFLARLLQPLARLFFPSIPPGHPALGAMTMNLSASCLGLGNAATPFGLRAMRELQSLNPRKDEASEAMCTFLALNTACIVFVPTTIIGIRTAAGSANPTEIIGPTLFATAVGTLATLSADQFFRRFSNRLRF